MEKKTILIVDDIPLMRMMLVKYLLTINKIHSENSEHPINMDLLEAANGQEALEMLSEHHVDLIFLDLMMPEMDGYTFLEKKSREEEQESIPVVITSAQCEKESVKQAEKYDVQDYLTKPFTLKAIQDQVERLLFQNETE